MIPSSVELTNFLSHRSANGKPVVFDFDGAVLWSVAGDNGAGKSAVFDAITWTLYNQHRGGSQDAQRLISHGADGAHAAFVFMVDSTRYRVERSVRRRGSAQRTAMRWSDGKERWEEIPDTTSEGGFARWRDDLLGLSYEAFTHAVLLIQGGSDRLVASGAKERFEILAQLVDLSSYRRLEERARERAAEARARRGAQMAELERVPAVEPEAQAAAQADVERAEAERDRRQAAWKAQTAVVEGALAHGRLVERLAELDGQIAETETLLKDAEQIRADAAEHAGLVEARTHLGAGLDALTRAQAAHSAAHDAGERAEAIDVIALDRAVSAEKKRSRAATRAAEQARERASALRGKLPALETALQRRVELLDANAAAVQAGASERIAADLERAKGMVAELRGAREHAQEAERRGQQQLADAAAAARDAEAALEAYRAGARELVCQRCGQEVPPEHRHLHLAHLEEDVAAKRTARADAEQALGQLSRSRRETDDAVERAGEIIATLERAHDRAIEAERAVDRARAAATAAREAVGAWEDSRAAVLADGEREQVEALRADLREAAAVAEREEAELAGARDRAEEALRTATEQSAVGRKERERLELARERAEQAAAGEARRAEIELAQVPEAWTLRTRAGEADLLEAFEDRLSALAPAAERAGALQVAETSLAQRRAAREEVVTQIDAVAPEHRVAVAQAQARLARCTKALEQATARLEVTQREAHELERRERERGERREQLDRAALEERLAIRLATLLGRQGLQGHLIVRAARGLERLANDTLRALTGGALELEITAEERRGRDEVVISARDSNAGGESTDASFLSGSEKFRVCVAMAAAIGTYSSRRARIESLIIDEGFGGLDETGRDEMIDELQRLAQGLERVIVVSHQAEFHDRARFPHGYRLRRTAGATEVERFV
ncbi:MAG TPA: SMC family ATPase [Conexibacter sp.]|nr:SMC family ATPase [Conexibacter sp.]